MKNVMFILNFGTFLLLIPISFGNWKIHQEMGVMRQQALELQQRLFALEGLWQEKQSMQIETRPGMSQQKPKK